jgi:hypothetical protein
LRFVAKYGDACNLFVRLGDDELRRKLDVLRGHCEAEGRPYEEIEKTSLGPLFVTKDNREGSMSPQQAIDFLGHVAEMGFDHALISMPNVSHPDAFDLFRDDVVPAVHGLPVTGR